MIVIVASTKLKSSHTPMYQCNNSSCQTRVTAYELQTVKHIEIIARKSNNSLGWKTSAAERVQSERTQKNIRFIFPRWLPSCRAPTGARYMASCKQQKLWAASNWWLIRSWTRERTNAWTDECVSKRMRCCLLSNGRYNMGHNKHFLVFCLFSRVLYCYVRTFCTRDDRFH